MIGGCARIILVLFFISTEVRGTENGVTETVFRKIFAPDKDVPVQYRSLDGKGERISKFDSVQYQSSTNHFMKI